MTRSGQERAPVDLKGPGVRMLGSSGQFSTTDRFSDYFVKGQVAGAAGARAKAAPMTPGTTPQDRVRAYLGGGSGSGGAAGGKEAGGVTVLGHARDPEVTRWRPLVVQMKAGGNSESAQKQADWMARVHRARGDQANVPLQGWHWGGGLWRPNQLTRLTDSFLMVERDYLVGGVSMSKEEAGGEITELRLVGPEAYDPEETDETA